MSLLAGLVGAYALAAFLTRDQWAATADRDGTEVTFAATTPDGSPPTPDELARTRKVVSHRVAALGISGAAVAVDGSTVTVTVPGNGDDVRDSSAREADCTCAPSLHAIPAERRSRPARPHAARAGHDRQFRRRRSRTRRRCARAPTRAFSVLALQLQATRCTDEDALAGNDDPNLPLVTCSQDGELVYLLDRSIISGDQIAERRRRSTMSSAANTPSRWSSIRTPRRSSRRFTAANVGTQIAYTLDTRVISAPQIQEPIPGVES